MPLLPQNYYFDLVIVVCSHTPCTPRKLAYIAIEIPTTHTLRSNVPEYLYRINLQVNLTAGADEQPSKVS